MDPVYGLLRERLTDARRLAVLGVGSTLRSDDAAGIRIVSSLQAAFGPKYPGLLFCVGGTAPENFSGTIRRFNPDILLIIDSADFGAKAGTIMEIKPETIGGPTYCSHMLPLRVMIDYLAVESGARFILLGIQYKSLAFDSEMTPEIRNAADRLEGALKEIILNNHPALGDPPRRGII